MSDEPPIDDPRNQFGGDAPADASVPLAESTGTQPAIDALPRMFEPPPVRLLTVNDAQLLAPAGMERQLDGFYVKLLKFQREDPSAATAAAETLGPVYRSANFAIRFEVGEPPLVRDDLRALGVQVPSLGLLESELIELEIAYTWQRGLTPGEVSIFLQDPAGNWINLTATNLIW